MLKSTNPRNGWGAFAISVVVLGFFGYLLWFATARGLPKDDASAQQLVGALIAALSGVLNFWIGSSRSSQAKDDTIAQQATNTQEALRATPPPTTGALPSPPTTTATATGTPVAAFLALSAVSLALLLSGQPASAASQPAPAQLTRRADLPRQIGPNCGWPVPEPECHASDIKTPPPSQDAFNRLKALIIDDVTWAKNKAAADSPPDTRHGKCWIAILAWLTGPNSPTFVPPHLGIASALQMSFDAAGGPGKFIPDDVADGCGATALDARIELLRLLNDIGMTALLPK